MAIVPGAVHILHLVVVEVFVHGDNPDVLWRVLVVYGEVLAVRISQFESEFIFQDVAVVDGCLPGIHDVSVDVELHLAAIRTIEVCPVIIGIDLGVEHQFGEYEQGHGLRDTSVEVSAVYAVF